MNSFGLNSSWVYISPSEQRESRINGETDESGQQSFPNDGKTPQSGGATGKTNKPEGISGGKRKESKRRG